MSLLSCVATDVAGVGGPRLNMGFNFGGLAGRGADGFAFILPEAANAGRRCGELLPLCIVVNGALPGSFEGLALTVCEKVGIGALAVEGGALVEAARWLRVAGVFMRLLVDAGSLKVALRALGAAAGLATADGGPAGVLDLGGAVFAIDAASSSSSR